MADVRREKFMRRYRRFFSCGAPTVGDGWDELLELALRRVEAAMAGERKDAVFAIVQVKEKFGTIRIYYEARSLSAPAKEAIEEAVDLAEARSACTCEICGSEGRLFDGLGWFTTRCTRHADGDPVPVAHGHANLQIVWTAHKGGVRVETCRRYDRERDMFIDAPLPDDWKTE